MQHLLFKGKQLDYSSPLSVYNIGKYAIVLMALRLWGREWGCGKAFLLLGFFLKDVAHAQSSPNAAQSQVVPGSFLVKKSEEVPSSEISHPSLEDLH